MPDSVIDDPKPEGTPSPVPEPVVPVVEPVVAPEPSPVPESVPEPVPEPVVTKKPDWRDGRIAELTAKLNQAKAKQVEPAKTGTETEAEFEARVNARAEVLAAERTAVQNWDQACNAVFTNGSKLHPDFGDKLKELKSTINAGDQSEVQQYNDVLATVMETGKAPELLYELSQDPGEFRRLMTLSTVKRGMELAARAATLGAAPEPSNVPKPIRPISSTGAHFEEIQPDDAARGMKIPTAEWMRRREKQAEERGIQ